MTARRIGPLAHLCAVQAKPPSMAFKMSLLVFLFSRDIEKNILYVHYHENFQRFSLSIQELDNRWYSKYQEIIL
jgi:hypothetical protein